MSDYEFSMPFPPSVNMYFTHSRHHGRKILGKRGRAYKNDCMEALESLGLCGEGITERVSVVIHMRPPTIAKRDLDNYLKAPLDALSDAEFWDDDSQIDSLKIVRKEKVKGGRLDVFVDRLT